MLRENALFIFAGIMAAAVFSTLPAGPSAIAKTSKTSNLAQVPDILFLGDSQLSFGAGRVFQTVFRDFEQHCGRYETFRGASKAIAAQRFSLMGVKSTSFHNWVSKRRRHKKMVCEPDPKWPVNARLYGFPHRTDGSYVQFGRDSSFPFCRKGQSPLGALFNWGKPKIVVFYFMGNAVSRWARSPKAALRDAAAMEQLLPESVGCVVMTTSPTFRRKDNRRRQKAQSNLAAAFAEPGRKCHFVKMITKRTIAAIQGQSRHFRRHKNGRVKDPYHPGTAAARRLVALEQAPFCRAVLSAMRPHLSAQP